MRRRRPGLLASSHAGAAQRHADAEGIPLLPQPYHLDKLEAAVRATLERHLAREPGP